MPFASPPALSTSTTSSKPFSISLKSKQFKSAAHTPSSTLNPKKRPHSTLAHESDSEPDTNSHPEPQLLASFDHAAGGAILANDESAGGTKKAPLVIPAQKNRDWREESRKKWAGRNLLPKEEQELRAGKVADGDTNGEGEPIQYGLNFVQRDTRTLTDSAVTGDIKMQDGQPTRNGAAKSTPPHLTADEEALEALKGTSKKTSNLVIGVPASNGNKAEASETSSLFARVQPAALSEAQLFKADVASRPDSASIDEYASVPVEEFGKALMRGMGWVEETDADGKASNGINGAGKKMAGERGRMVERRPALLGIGAKEVPKELREELGAWGKGAQGGGSERGKKAKKEVGYNPVVLRDRRTGEMITEEELEKRVREGRQMVAEEESRAREKERRKEREKQESRSRRYEDDSDDSDRRDRERRRERERDADGKSKHSRHARYNEGYDSDRRNRRRDLDERDSARDSGRDRKHRDKDRRRCDDYDDAYEKEKDRRTERDGDRRERRREYDDRDRRRHRDRD